MTSRTRRVTLLLFAADICLTLGALYLADTLRHVLPFGLGDGEHLAWISWRHYVAVAAIWAFFLYVFNVYEPRRMFTVVDEIRMLVPAISIAFVLLFTYFFLAKVEYLSRLLFAYFYVLNLLLLVNLRWVLRLAMRSSFGLGLARRLVIAGAGPVGRQVAGLLQNRPWTGYSIVGFLDDNVELIGREIDGIRVLGRCDELAEIIEQKHVARGDRRPALPLVRADSAYSDSLSEPSRQDPGSPRPLQYRQRQGAGRGLVGDSPDRHPRTGNRRLRQPR